MRRWLFAVLCCLTAWTALAQMVPPTPDAAITAAADVSSETDADAPRGAGDPDGRLHADSRANASVHESIWTSSAVHADLAAARSGDPVIETEPVARRNRSARNRSAHLLHIPLLI